MNTMVEIYLYLWKSLNYITIVYNIILCLPLITQILQVVLCFAKIYNEIKHYSVTIDTQSKHAIELLK